MADNERKVIVQPNGPYVVRGGIPLVRKSPVMSEHGEPLTWKKEETLTDQSNYLLCRCGNSSEKPFCDGTHSWTPFDGTETADTSSVDSRATVYNGTRIALQDDHSMCMHAGFCGNAITNVWKMIEQSDDSRVRGHLMAMIERCPSGTLAYALEPEGENLEPDLPVEIAVTPDGALWVSGGITVERSDGQPFETRNRVTLCRCGNSKNKPLCDGTHKEIGFSG
jgi:CDGSH-type Zn-finger protein